MKCIGLPHVWQAALSMATGAETVVGMVKSIHRVYMRLRRASIGWTALGQAGRSAGQHASMASSPPWQS